MANGYLSKPADKLPLTRVRAVDLNTLASAVDTAFDKLPTETDLKQNKTTFGADTGTQNNYIVTLPYSLAAYAEGLEVNIRVSLTNTGAVSVNVNGLGVKAIKFPGGQDVTSGMIPAGSYLNLRYDNTNGYFVIAGAIQVTGTVNLTDANTSALALAAGAALFGGM